LPRIPHSEYPLRFHGNDDRVDVESLRLSTRSAGTSSAEGQGVLTPQGIKGIRIARGPGRGHPVVPPPRLLL